LTGGGSQLLHVRQLFQYVTGMDCRIGTPDMHLASAPNKAVTTPLFSTGIGLVKLGFTNENEGKGSNNSGADEPDRGGKSRFLDRIKKFFEEETAE
jgi:cell division protein FtsA